jgi:hypothetical protein
MAEDKNVKKADVKVAVAKPKKVTIADTVRALGAVGAKDRAEFAQKVVAHLKGKGITKNIKGQLITPEHVTAQIGAIIGCITTETGPKDWKNYKVVEDENQLKIMLK